MLERVLPVRAERLTDNRECRAGYTQKDSSASASSMKTEKFSDYGSTSETFARALRRLQKYYS